MTEKELRQKVVNTAISYLGCKESNGSHKKIIDLYNSHKPLARGYKVKYTDAWCSTFVSAVSVKCGLTDIIPTECGCGKHIELFQKLGAWVEKDSYIPSPGDVIFYAWSDSGKGDNALYPDHVGIVVSVSGSVIKVIEGNKDNSVAYRNIAVNGRYIRGYGVPKYSTKATTKETTKATTTEKEVKEVRYNKLKEITSEHYRPTIDKLIKKGVLLGRDGEGEEMVIDLSEDSVRLLVILDRAGVFGK